MSSYNNFNQNLSFKSLIFLKTSKSSNLFMPSLALSSFRSHLKKILHYNSSSKVVGIVGKFFDLNSFIFLNLFFKSIFSTSCSRQNSAFLKVYS